MRRDVGEPFPWTRDKVLQQFRFCNVFREDDMVTVWFRENIRNYHDQGSSRLLVMATTAFRMFNRISTGELLYPMLIHDGWKTDKARHLLANAKPPLFTGAYMVRTPNGIPKLEGALWMMDEFNKRRIAHKVTQCKSLQEAHEIICTSPFQGAFTAYEVVTDLSHTCLLRNAPDILTWANPGPGARRGLMRVYSETLTWGQVSKMVALMRSLLEVSRFGKYWPSEWPEWDMRTVEHTLCEFDKYQRGQEGGTFKRRYKAPGQ